MNRRSRIIQSYGSGVGYSLSAPLGYTGSRIFGFYARSRITASVGRSRPFDPGPFGLVPKHLVWNLKEAPNSGGVCSGGDPALVTIGQHPSVKGR